MATKQQYSSGTSIKDKKEILNFIEHIISTLDIDRQLVSENIETETSRTIRNLTTNQDQFVRDSFQRADSALGSQLISGVNKYLQTSDDVIKAKVLSKSSAFRYLLVLKEKSDKEKDRLYEISHSLLESSLGSKYQIFFDFVDDKLYSNISEGIIVKS